MNQPRRPGCLSPLAIASVFATLVIIALVEVISGNSMFSPGALNAQAGETLGGVASHAEIGGNCAQCHPLPWSAQKMSDLCLSCHTNIQAELGDSASLHGVLAQDAPSPCQKCHTEHRGEAAGQTKIDSISYPHEKTGFTLAGHQTRKENTPFACSDCHTERISRFSQQTCTDCHRSLDAQYMDAHQENFGDGCLACHDGQDRYGNFDHSQTRFALKGSHLSLACSQCHPSARTTADLQKAATDCAACHHADDAHDGRFGAQCETCHSTTNWKDATFDHSLSAFPLDGAHRQVDCQGCHKNNVFKGTPQECAACHADPAFHAGLFPNQACSACHTTTAWRPARFNGSHPFPINHGKTNNACADCHQPNLTQWTCYTCHAQAETARKHQKEGIANFTDCLGCHPTGQKDESGGD